MTREVRRARGAAACVVAMLMSYAGVSAAGKDGSPSYTPQVGAELVSTLTALTASLDGNAGMSAGQIRAAEAKIDKDASFLGHDGKTIKAAFDLVSTYDKVKGPLWVNGVKFTRGTRHHRVQPPADINWTVYHVMQGIMDYVYTPENLRRYTKLFAGYKFGSSVNFPGAVAPPADGDAVYHVKIDGSYVMPFKHVIFQEDRPARRPTGAYVAPGSIVTVSVPKSIVGKGYDVRVGAQSWDDSSKPRVLRLDRCTLVYPIDSTNVKVANPLGGGIYIEVPLGSRSGVVEVSIRGAVRSPFFCSTPYHKTTLKQWLDEERHFKAPWADFQSQKFVMNVPTSWIYNLKDPVKLMSDWDKSLDAVTSLMGLPHVYGREVAYMQVDLQNRGKAFYPGYPMCNDRYKPGEDYGGYAKNYLVRGPEYAPDYPFHEMGHGFMFSKYAGDREAAVNLLFVAVLNEKFGVGLNEAFRRSRDIKNTFRTVDTTAIAWMMSQHFIDGKPMANYERQYQLKGHAKYVDIVRLFGWKTLDRFWHSIVVDEDRGIKWPVNVKDTDRLTLRLSEMAGVDVRPLIAFWGIPTLHDAASDAAIKSARLGESAKIYDLLEKCKGLVPKNRKAFQQFALSWWGKRPSEKGFTTERNHAALWDTYDAQVAAKVRGRVQDIVNRYFPNGRPK